MGYTLVSDSDRRLSLSVHTWAYALALAECEGWEPAGTEAPCPDGGEPYNVGYVVNEQQYVRPPDAAAIAQSIRKALGRPGELPLADEGPDRARVAEIAEFCEAGGFVIF